MEIKLQVDVAWREFANQNRIPADNMEQKRAFYAGVKWADQTMADFDTLSAEDAVKVIMAVKAELAEFSGQTLQEYLSYKRQRRQKGAFNHRGTEAQRGGGGC